MLAPPQPRGGSALNVSSGSIRKGVGEGATMAAAEVARQSVSACMQPPVIRSPLLHWQMHAVICTHRES